PAGDHRSLSAGARRRGAPAAQGPAGARAHRADHAGRRVTALRHLFQPARIGPMDVGNRIMMPGMSAGMMLDEEGRPTPEMIAYYVERARNRPGMIAIGSAAIVPPPGVRKHPLSLHDDKYIPALKALVDAVHAY